MPTKKLLGTNGRREPKNKLGKLADETKSDEWSYHKRMKSIPDPETTPSEKMRMFREGLRQVLTVSKGELVEREKKYQDERSAVPKRGPKPKPSGPGTSQ
jgi:hypothetical protein